MVKWYLPTFYGDIRLESQGESRTLVTLHGLTAEERHAMNKLLERARKGNVLRKAWASQKEIDAIDLETTAKEQRLVLEAPITDVHGVLSKALRSDKKTLSAVRFSGGKIEEVTAANQKLIVTSTASTEPEPESKPTVAATVKAPVLGCPAPDFPNADVLATEVLRAFLSPEQLDDFVRHQAFIAIGADTGHRYQLTSRHCRSKLRTVNRVLFDLDENRELCVHDWDVPASEELLSIFLHVACREGYLLRLPDFRLPDYVQ